MKDNRRKFLQKSGLIGLGLTGANLLGSCTQKPSSHNRKYRKKPIFNMCGYNVKDYGAKGDGRHDDTEAIELTLLRCDDGVIIFPRGEYRITRQIKINLSSTGKIGLRGEGGSSTIIMNGKGPAFHIIGTHEGTADPNTIGDEVWGKERMPLIQDLEIVGKHPEASGIEISNTLQIIVQSVLIRNMKYGIHFTSRNRNVLIYACHIFDCKEIGIYLDRVSIHQINISNCHISYNDRSGIKVEGGDIRNFQITGNDIEYNNAIDGKRSADIWIDNTIERSSVREGSITGNTIQALNSELGCNILFEGHENTRNKVGLWSITGNHIGTQSTNIHLKSVNGVSISGNTFNRGNERHIMIENSQNVVLGSNVFGRNTDYYRKNKGSKGGIRIENSENITCDNLILEEIHQQGAIEIIKSRQVSISNCQIKNSVSHGLFLKDSKQIIVNGCIISSKEEIQSQIGIVGIYLDSLSTRILISNNIFILGIRNQIINRSIAEGLMLNENMIVNDY